MYIKSINRTKNGWKTTIWDSDKKYLRYNIIEEETLQDTVDSIVEYIRKKKKDFTIEGREAKEIKDVDFPLSL